MAKQILELSLCFILLFHPLSSLCLPSTFQPLALTTFFFPYFTPSFTFLLSAFQQSFLKKEKIEKQGQPTVGLQCLASCHLFVHVCLHVLTDCFVCIADMYWDLPLCQARHWAPGRSWCTTHMQAPPGQGLQSTGEADGSLIFTRLGNYNFGKSYKGKMQGSGHMTKVPHLFEGIRDTPKPTTTARLVKAKETAQAKAMFQEGPDKGQKNNILEPKRGSKWWRGWA